MQRHDEGFVVLQLFVPQHGDGNSLCLFLRAKLDRAAGKRTTEVNFARFAAGLGLAMGHLSHSYVDGACLYFTVIYPLDPSHAVKQWGAIKRDATDAVVAEGGTVSHHHGVGIDHARWLAAEKGSVGLEALRAVKRDVDPEGVLNPGKLLCRRRAGRPRSAPWR